MSDCDYIYRLRDKSRTILFTGTQGCAPFFIPEYKIKEAAKP